MCRAIFELRTWRTRSGRSEARGGGGGTSRGSAQFLCTLSTEQSLPFLLMAMSRATLAMRRTSLSLHTHPRNQAEYRQVQRIMLALLMDRWVT